MDSGGPNTNYRVKYEKLVYNKVNEASDAPRISKDLLAQIREDFDLFCTDSEGLIKPKDQIRTFLKHGFDKKRPSVFRMIQSLDTEENNREGLTFEQFMNGANNYYSDRYSDEGVRRIFDLFSDGKEIITKDQFSNMAQELNMLFERYEIDQIFEKVSTDKEQRVISFTDFAFFMKKDEYQK